MALARALAAAFVYLLATTPLLAGTVERFLLPRTVPVRAIGIAAAADHAWVLPEWSTSVAKVGLDGAVLETVALPAHPQRLAIDPVDGSLWYANDSRLGHVLLSGEVVQFDLPLQQGFYSEAFDLIFHTDGFLWIIRTKDVLRVSRAGETTRFEISDEAYYSRLASGPDGNIWIAFHYPNTIGRLTPSGAITLFSNGPVDTDYPNGITAGPDGNLWFVSNFGRVRKITTAGAITDGVSSCCAGTFHIVNGADGRLWWNRNGTLSKFNIGSSTIETTYNVSTADDYLYSVSASTSGVWWVSDQKKIGRVTYAGESTSAPFNFLGAHPWMLASSADYVWFTAPDENQLGRVTPAGGHTVLYTLPHANSRPFGIVAGANFMWFTEESGDRIGRIDAAGALQEFTVPTTGGKPTGIAIGADGNLWTTLAAADKVVRMTTTGTFTEFALPEVGCQPTSIAAGADSNLWFTCEKSNEIGRITLAGAVTRFGAQGNSPSAITLASDGNLWYTTQLYNHRITPGGVVTSYLHSPVGWRGNRTWQRVAGPDGALWDNDSAIVRTTTDGISHVYSLNIGGSGITVGPDGKIWFSDSYTQSLNRLDPDAPMSGTGMNICPESNNLVNGAVATFTDPDPSRGAEAYTAMVDWADNTYPTAGQVSMTSPGHFVVSAAHNFQWSATRTIRIAFTALPGPGRVGATVTASTVVGGFTVTPNFISLPSEGGSGTITLAGADCPWTASVSNPAVITLGQTSGQGSGSLPFTVAPNTIPSQRVTYIYAAGTSITVTQAPHPSAFATGFYTIPPCRLVDTRITQDPLPGGGLMRTVWIPAGTCGIPSGTKVLSANVTVVGPSTGGWLSFHPPDVPWAGNSTLNYRTGQTRANNTLMQLASNGFAVLNFGNAPVHFIVDVNGYFK